MKTKKRIKKEIATVEYKLPSGMALGLRSCKPDFTSPSPNANGFKWPSAGRVTATDWNTDEHCGHGLHLLAHGEGDGSQLCFAPGAKWLVCQYDPAQSVDLNGKIKVPSCIVVFCGDASSAPAWIMAHDPLARSVVRGTATAGDSGTATAGDSGTATAGYSGTATAGDMGTATAGDSGTATAGDSGTATAGNRGTATAGDMGTATAGDMGTATAGYMGTATAGYMGTATAGYSGTAKSGDVGIVVVSWYDTSALRCRLCVGYVGEDGILPNTFYKCDLHGKLIAA